MSKMKLLLFLLLVVGSSASYHFFSNFGTNPEPISCDFANNTILQLFESSCTPNINTCEIGPNSGVQQVCVASPDDIPYSSVAVYQYNSNDCTGTASVVAVQSRDTCFGFGGWSYRNSCNATHSIRTLWHDSSVCSGSADTFEAMEINSCLAGGQGSSMNACYT